MAKRVMLDNIAHKDLKIIARYSAEFGDAAPNVPVFVNEFNYVQKEYPIFLHKDSATQKLIPIAMLGFKERENIFLDDASENGWDARYVPAVAARGPFLIGLQYQNPEDDTATPVVYVDLDDPRVNSVVGEPVFLPLGGTTPYLEGINQALQIIHQGEALNNAIVDLLISLQLIKPININVLFKNHHEYRLSGYYSIDQERLAALSPTELAQLHAAGFLAAVYYMVSSLTNLPVMIDIKNKRIDDMAVL